MMQHPSERYSRQTSLKEFGSAGQEKLRQASVLVVGAGGLGCPALQYLTAAGIGRLGIVDGDTVALSNLQRQVLYSTEDVGKLKAACAAVTLEKLNPEAKFEVFPLFLSAENAADMIRGFDLVIDGTDNFESRYLVNDTCVVLNKPLIYGSVSRFEGQVAVFNHGQDAVNYRDLFPMPPQPGEVLNCEEAGVLGVLPGIIGTLQATEAIKIITGIGSPLQNELLMVNVLTHEWVKLTIPSRKDTRQLIPATEEELRNYNYSPSQPVCGHDYTDIEPHELEALMANENCLLIDVREPGEHPVLTTLKHLEMPLSRLKERPADLHNRSVILFCHSGIRSVTAMEYFPPDNKLYNLKGGIVKWLRYKQTGSLSTYNP